MNQQDMIRRLSMGEGFGNIPPERIDTHVSTVFLIGDDAYKMKHAIATSYLNYASLEDRHRLCQAELDINRRTAPQIYLDLVPVRLTPEDNLILGDGDGTPVEWLVHMRRFPQDSLLDFVAENHGLTSPMMVDLADTLANFHKTAKPVEDHKASNRIAAVIEENETELKGYSGGVFDESSVTIFTRACRTHFEKHINRLNQRGEFWFVRHCHGDLHLRNICLIDSKPTLFDAIEFNDDISQIDILFDLAFLLMDLEHRGLRHHANVLFNRYLFRTEDVDDLVLLPLYLALRAGIRAHTSAMAAEMAHDESYRAQLEKDATEYLALGLSFFGSSSTTLVALGGLSGAGKSTIAAEIAPHIGNVPGALILSSDLIRKRQMQVEPLARLEETAYTKEVDDRVYDELMDTATRVLADGHSVVLDATFQDAETREEAESIGRIPGTAFNGFWLQANSMKLYDRVDGRKNDPSDATLSVLAHQLENDVGEITWHRIDADRPIPAVAQSVRNNMSDTSAPATKQNTPREPHEYSF